MSRVKRGVTHNKRRKTILAKVKGYKWGRKNTLRLAKTAILKAGVNAFRGRKEKKRVMRGLHQIKISAFVKEVGLSYSRFIDLMKKSKVGLDRKILADLAQNNKEVLKGIIAKITK